MADVNLGQISAIWLDDSEPPHKNCLWVKTINLLTSEKAGFIWNGIEWINIQGEGFNWSGEFDLATDYKKNDVVLFEASLYIKLNDVVNNLDNPDANSDYDLFITADVLLSLQNFWTLLQEFNIIKTNQIYTTKQTITATGTNPIIAVNLDNGSFIVLDITNADGTLNLSLSNGKIGGSYWILVKQAATKVDITLTNEGRLDGDAGSLIIGTDNVDYCIYPSYTGTGFILNIGQLT